MYCACIIIGPMSITNSYVPMYLESPVSCLVATHETSSWIILLCPSCIGLSFYLILFHILLPLHLSHCYRLQRVIPQSDIGFKVTYLLSTIVFGCQSGFPLCLDAGRYPSGQVSASHVVFLYIFFLSIPMMFCLGFLLSR